jgi:hypothetical protein
MAEQNLIQAIFGIEYIIKKLEFLMYELNYRLVSEPNKILADSVSLGFPKEISERYRNGYMAKNEEDVRILITDIQRLHIPYLESVIQDLKNALNR